jgi:hypothetical protein
VGDLLSLCAYKKLREASTERGLIIEAQSPFMIVRHLWNGSVQREERVLSESMLRDLLDAHGPWSEE